jgi:DNA-directed RNA polymerase subunit RPC12/RpoP
MAAIYVICPYCEYDVFIHPAQANRCPYCGCLFKIAPKEEYEDDQIYTTVLLKQGVNQKGSK